MNKRLIGFLILLPIAMPQIVSAAARENIALAGTWRFELDPKDSGIREKFFAQYLPQTIQLPGSLQEQGFGLPPSLDSNWAVNDSSLQAFKTDPKFAPYRDPANFKSPCWLTPKRHYVGPAWYQRDIDIPQEWRDKHVVLRLERPHWQSEVWIDDRKIGRLDSLGTRHDYDLTEFTAPGKHRLTIRIDNRLNIPVGPHAHSVTDMSQTNWNGIVGDISLIATNRARIDAVRVFPNVSARRMDVAVDIENDAGDVSDASLSISADLFNAADAAALPALEHPVHLTGKRQTIELDYSLGEHAATWDEFSPALYRMKIALHTEHTGDVCTAICGLRQITTSGTQFMLNGHPIQFRGTLECAIFPLTGYPPTDVAAWKRILTIARQYGLNHLRFHTWCPPEAAFTAADEMGFYFGVECSCWGKFGGGGPLDTWMPAEGAPMLRAYGNHPSFMLMAATNEPKGKPAADFLASVVSNWRAADPRRLYTAGAGAQTVNYPGSDFHIEYATRFHQADGELARPPQTMEDYRAFIDKQPFPCIAHELGQWCAYPDFDEIPKFNGVVFAGNLEIFRDFLNHSGLGGYAHDFVTASGKFQVQLYKAEIEKVLRTPHMGGFELLDLHDFPGQGTSPVGVLDEFWDSKGYVTPEEYRRFCAPTVLLARFPARTFTANESVDIPLEISHFGPADLPSAAVSWRIRDTHANVLASGSLPSRNITTGQLTALATISLPLAQLPAPAQYRLEVCIDATTIANDWDFWLYPASTDSTIPTGISIAHDLSAATLDVISNGSDTLILLPPKTIAGDTFGAFEPIFWNRILFPHQLNHTLGIFCDPHLPALAGFPTENHSNWQWWDLQQHSKPMILDHFSKDLYPIVQMIDDWTQCRKLGLVIEARIGRGRLIVSSIDLESDLAHRPVARQLRRSLLDYMASPGFSPSTVVTAQQLQSLTSTSLK